jgi:hypothetical protein
VLDDTRSGYDADDMFGLRRALEALPAPDWEQFLLEWRSLTEVADFEVTALHSALRHRNWSRRGSEGTSDPFATAWDIVADATSRYVAWRDARTEPGDLAVRSPVGGVAAASRAS